MRTITFTLDKASIAKAIEEVKRYKTDFQQKIQELMEALVAEGEKEAKIQIAFMSAIDTGQLESSIRGYYDPNLKCGFVIAGTDYAAFVEYGTGVVGAGAPHPLPAGWAYDVNSHGEKGWVYHSDRDGKFHWTKGMPSRPFMYETRKHLERVMTQIARNVLSTL